MITLMCKTFLKMQILILQKTQTFKDKKAVAILFLELEF